MRSSLLVASVITLALFAGAQTKADRTLKIKLNYTGSGKVDAGHKIFVFLFDSPDFMQGGVMPIASESATAKDQTVTLSGLSADVVYVAAAFDPNRTYDGASGPPPTGSSMGLYSKEPGKPAPIKLEPGKTAEVELSFNDTVKMP